MPEDEYEKVLPLLEELGEAAGNELDSLSREADKNEPELVTYNKYGERVNEIIYHESYRKMEGIGYGKFGLAAMSHRPGVMGWPKPFSKVLKYAFWYLFAQAEFGLCCPMSMTDSAARILEQYADKELQEKYLPRMLSTDMEELWTGAQFMTEKGGSTWV